MYRLNLFLSVLILIVINPGVFAQTIHIETLPADSIIDMGTQLHDEEKYEEAILTYSRISPCDPNYNLACYETALSLHAAGRNKEALEKCREAMDLDYEAPELYSLAGTLYEELGMPEEGIKLVKRALEKWPYNQNLLYNLAVTLNNTGEYEAAEAVLIKGMKINPYHPGTHLALGEINYRMGRNAQSLLAYCFACLLNPSMSYLSEYENTLLGKNDSISKGYLFHYPEGFNHQHWDYLRNIITSDIGNHPEFEYNKDLNFTIFRTALAVFRKLKFNPEDKTIYNQFYTRFFLQCYEKQYYEAYSNYLLNRINNSSGNEWAEKNEDLLNTFVNWASTFINEKRNYCLDYENEKKAVGIYQFDEDGTLSGIGSYNTKDGMKYGEWIHLYNNGAISQKGHYKNNMANGEWLMYFDGGGIKMILNMEDDKLQGTSKTFYPDGSLESTHEFKNGERHGKVTYLTPSGLISSVVSYEKGLAEGPAYFYHYTDGYKRMVIYEQDTLMGPFQETWFNNNPYSSGSYVSGEYDGIYQSWYVNGNPVTKFGYNKGLKTGKWTDYFITGSTEATGEYDEDGERTGEVMKYSLDGKLLVRDSIYTKGKLNGFHIEYFEDGKIKDKYIYKDDVLVEFWSYNKTGDLIMHQKAEGDSLEYYYFYPDGRIMQKGMYYKENMVGNWRKYSPQGVLIENYNYSENNQQGPQETYYEDGSLKELYSCDSGFISGIYKSFYRNNQLEMIGAYKPNGGNGEWKQFYPDGSLEASYYLEDWNFVGIKTEYDPLGNITDEEYYNENYELKRKKYFDPLGKLILDQKMDTAVINIKLEYKGKPYLEHSYIDRYLHGKYKEYYPDGKPLRTMNFEYGTLDGKYIKYYTDGMKKLELNYEYGEIEGEGIWYKNGNRDYVAHFVESQYQDTAIDYYSNGKIAVKKAFVDNQKYGWSLYYCEDEPSYRLNFYNDMLLGYSYPDKEGNFIPEIIVDSSMRKITGFFPNGKKSVEIDIVNGVRHGKMKEYFPSGKLKKLANYQKGENQGPLKTYYASGVLKKESNYRFDLLDGSYTEYYPSGKIKIKGEYLLGEKEGDWQYFYENGETKKIVSYNYGKVYDIR